MKGYTEFDSYLDKAAADRAKRKPVVSNLQKKAALKVDNLQAQAEPDMRGGVVERTIKNAGADRHRENMLGSRFKSFKSASEPARNVENARMMAANVKKENRMRGKKTGGGY